MTAQAPAHLLLAERDERFRDLLRQYLAKQGFLVSLARDVAHARRLLSGLEFDLILLDLALDDAPNLAGEATQSMLTMVPGGLAAPHGEQIAKPFDPAALRDRINTILDRRAPEPVPGPRTVHLGPLRFDVEQGALLRGDEPVRLTTTETQLMRIFSSALGTPLGRGELVARLGREGLQAKARAVDVQITRLRRKVEDDPKAPRFLQTVRGSGYMLVEG